MSESVTALPKTVPIPNAEISIPRIGFGVYKIPPSSCKQACLTALEAGYRHIDCAQLYKSEAEVREAVRESGVPRNEIFLTTKIKTCSSNLSPYEQMVESVRKMDGPEGHVELLLLHTPRFRNNMLKEVWQALERLHDEGKVSVIGVSNFGIQHLEDMKTYAKSWPPRVNQIELHPWCQQRELVQYCRKHGIIIQAYSPLAQGARLSDPVITAISKKYAKSSAQLLIRYSVQKGYIPLPRSSTPARIRENLDIFDFDIAQPDMDALDALDQGKHGAIFPANIT